MHCCSIHALNTHAHTLDTNGPNNIHAHTICTTCTIALSPYAHKYTLFVHKPVHFCPDNQIYTKTLQNHSKNQQMCTFDTPLIGVARRICTEIWHKSISTGYYLLKYAENTHSAPLIGVALQMVNTQIHQIRSKHILTLKIHSKYGLDRKLY